MRLDLKNDVNVASSLRPASQAAAVNGAGVDLTGHDGVMVVLDLGAIGGTTPSFTFQVQDSDDNSTFAAVAADFLRDGQPAAFTTGNQVVRIGYHGVKRYVRVAITAATGTAPTLVCSATVVRGKGRLRPA